ncbi:MAG: LamG domain-containing protein [Planctomycetota bacterium]|jgi:hypothetical protein
MREFNNGTDPTNWDTDGDERTDGEEVTGFDWNGNPVPISDPVNVDTDGDRLVDGLSDAVLVADYPEGVPYKDDPSYVAGELTGWGNPWMPVSPTNEHSDPDGMNDGWEVRHKITSGGEYFHPALDKAEDFWCDPPVSYSVWDFEYDRSGWCTWSGDGLRNLIESEHNTNPWSDDSDGDYVKDFAEITYGGYGGPPSYPPTTTPHLAGHWKMDNDGQAPQLTDSSDNQNHGTIYGATFNSSGKFDEALRFDGSNDYVSLGNPSELQFGSGTDFTISVWIKTSMASAGRLVDNKEASDGKGIRLHFAGEGDKIKGQIKDTAGDSIDISGYSTIYDGQWHHIALSADRDESCRLYVDGKQEACVSMRLIDDINSVANFKLGGTNGWLSGSMDDLMIFKKALPPSEITSLFDGTADYDEQVETGSASDVFPVGTGTDPRGIDTDGDGVLEGLDSDRDGLVDGKDNKVPISAYPDGVDADGDGYVDGEMNSSGIYVTNPRWFDTDGDMLTDGWEMVHGLDPTDATGDDGQYGDFDSDGADNFTEYKYGTDPSDDADNPDALIAAGKQYVDLRLTVGDPSGSDSEHYQLEVGHIAHMAPGFGQVSWGDYPFEVGQTYQIRIRHLSGRYFPYDYDYTASVQAKDPSDEWMVTISDPKGILGLHNSNPGDDFFAWGKVATVTIGGKLELFRDSGYTQVLDDWPEDGDQIRSPKYVFGSLDFIYVQLKGALGSDPATAEVIQNAIKVTTDSGGLQYLGLKETGANTQVFRGTEPGQQLRLSEWERAYDGDKAVHVIDEATLTFHVKHPVSGTYSAYKDVMVDRGEYAIATQTPDWILGYGAAVAKDFEPPLRDHFKWSSNGHMRGPTEDFIRNAGADLKSQCDIFCITGHGLPADDPGYYAIKLNGVDYEVTDDGYWIAAHEDSWGTAIGYIYWNDHWKLNTMLGAVGGIEDNWGTDVEWVIMNSCGLLKNDTPSTPQHSNQIWNKGVWDDTLFGNRPAHGLFGYADSAFAKDIDEVIVLFLSKLKTGETLVSAWKQAVVGGMWWHDYGIVMHAANANDKLTEPTADTRSTSMMYWYSKWQAHQPPIAYTDIRDQTASERTTPISVKVDIPWTPSERREQAKYVVAERQAVELAGFLEQPTRSDHQILIPDKGTNLWLQGRTSAEDIARAIDPNFSKVVQSATSHEEEFDAETLNVSSSAVVGEILGFAYDDPHFPIARGGTGNYVRIMMEHGAPILVVARFTKPRGYRSSDELMISQREAVEKVRNRIQGTSRFGAKCTITGATLEYEESRKREPGGAKELVPVWRVDLQSNKGGAAVYVPALANEDLLQL